MEGRKGDQHCQSRGQSDDEEECANVPKRSPLTICDSVHRIPVLPWGRDPPAVNQEVCSETNGGNDGSRLSCVKRERESE